MDFSLIVFKLVDALRVPICIQGGKVSGEAKISLKLAPGMVLPLHVQVQKVFHNEQAGVLAHIRGDLYILVAHNPNGNGTSAYLIDRTKCFSSNGEKSTPRHMFHSSHNLREVINAIKPAVVAAFYRKSGDWGKLSLPS